MRSRSNSANTASSWTIMRPAGLRVSMLSQADTHADADGVESLHEGQQVQQATAKTVEPGDDDYLDAARGCFGDLLQRGAGVLAPDTSGSMYSPTTLQPCRRATARPCLSWQSIDVPSTCPPVDTRA
jgi:hypothetical protein